MSIDAFNMNLRVPAFSWNMVDFHKRSSFSWQASARRDPWTKGIKVKMAKYNILLMVKVFPGYSTVKKYKRENFNVGSAHW